jgi:hypothetical protein
MPPAPRTSGSLAIQGPVWNRRRPATNFCLGGLEECRYTRPYFISGTRVCTCSRRRQVTIDPSSTSCCRKIHRSSHRLLSRGGKRCAFGEYPKDIELGRGRRAGKKRPQANTTTQREQGPKRALSGLNGFERLRVQSDRAVAA